jgi:hypothetical protein
LAAARALHAPTILLVYPFRFRDPLTRKWTKARYLAERRELEERYVEFEIIGEPEIRWPVGVGFNPWRQNWSTP